MHLSEVGDFKVGDKIYENQEIGKMGGSGFGKENAYTSHLHYELKLNNEKINPIGSDGNPIDPQLLLNPNEVFSKTPEQSTTSKASTQTQSTKNTNNSIWSAFKEIWKGNFNDNSNQ